MTPPASAQPAAPLPTGTPAPAAQAPAPSVAPEGGVGAFFSAAVQQVARIVKPEAATAVAVGFGFPLVLTVAVTGFLAIQNRLDSRDPKLRLAPRSNVETIVKFREEAEL
jgi:hypothetical protein